MRIAFIGGGAMGGSHAALLSLAGHEVRILDRNEAHVRAIERHGLRLDGARGSHVVPLAVATAPREQDREWAELVVVFTDSNATREAAVVAREVMGPGGVAVTFQNGVGNVETLIEVLGEGRVLGGSSMSSALFRGPGHVELTHVGPLSLGEWRRPPGERVEALAALFEAAGLPAMAIEDIEAVIWKKFLVNVGVNAMCAITGLRMGELVRVPELDRLQDRVLDEAFAIVRARGLGLDEREVRDAIKEACRTRFNKPSMLQHIEAGRRTEIDAMNGAIVREGRERGIPVPYNEAVAALLRGREVQAIRARSDPPVDYEAWEARVLAGEED